MAVFLRGSSYYLKIRSGRRQVLRSLHTTDSVEAMARAATLQRHLGGHFDTSPDTKTLFLPAKSPERPVLGELFKTHRAQITQHIDKGHLRPSYGLDADGQSPSSASAVNVTSFFVAHFVEQGARVGFVDFDAEAGRALVAELGPNAEHCHFVEADLRDIVQLRAAMVQLTRELDRTPTVLVNNAARDDRHTIAEVTPEYWDERMATNLRHQFFSAQALIPGMAEAGGGSIINMSSVSFLLAQGGMPVYLTAKSAVIGLARALARDLGPHRIRVNSVIPGWIMTERQTRLWLTPEGERKIAQEQCIPEKLYPPDIARMVLWLAADDSRLVTAQSFVVDGGWT